ncbi:MAG: ABC transporter substrate-binding protein, partial [Cyanobacteria bacterium P01_H01_bin.119]
IFWLESYRTSIAALLEEIGFELVLLDGLPRETPNSPSSPQVSVETLVQLNPDIIIVSAIRGDNLDNPEEIARQKWKENPLLQNMQAVQAGRIRFVNSRLLGRTREGVIASKVTLDLLPELLLPFVEEK